MMKNLISNLLLFFFCTFSLQASQTSKEATSDQAAESFPGKECIELLFSEKFSGPKYWKDLLLYSNQKDICIHDLNSSKPALCVLQVPIKHSFKWRIIEDNLVYKYSMMEIYKGDKKQCFIVSAIHMKKLLRKARDTKNDGKVSEKDFNKLSFETPIRGDELGYSFKDLQKGPFPGTFCAKILSNYNNKPKTLNYFLLANLNDINKKNEIRYCLLKTDGCSYNDALDKSLATNDNRQEFFLDHYKMSNLLSEGNQLYYYYFDKKEHRNMKVKKAILENFTFQKMSNKKKQQFKIQSYVEIPNSDENIWNSSYTRAPDRDDELTCDNEVRLRATSFSLDGTSFFALLDHTYGMTDTQKARCQKYSIQTIQNGRWGLTLDQDKIIDFKKEGKLQGNFTLSPDGNYLYLKHDEPFLSLYIPPNETKKPKEKEILFIDANTLEKESSIILNKETPYIFNADRKRFFTKCEDNYTVYQLYTCEEKKLLAQGYLRQLQNEEDQKRYSFADIASIVFMYFINHSFSFSKNNSYDFFFLTKDDI